MARGKGKAGANKASEPIGNPASDLDLLRAVKSLPKDIPTSSEAEIIMNQPDMSTVGGMRDRAILETLYSTGCDVASC